MVTQLPLQLLDTKFDPVRIVAAAPDASILEKGVGPDGRKLIVASEYEGICRQWIKERGLNVSLTYDFYMVVAAHHLRPTG